MICRGTIEDILQRGIVCWEDTAGIGPVIVGNGLVTIGSGLVIAGSLAPDEESMESTSDGVSGR